MNTKENIQWEDFFRLVLTITLGFGTYAWIMYTIPSAWNFLRLNESWHSTMHQLLIVFYLIVPYILVTGTAICFAALIKRGFLNLKKSGKGIVSETVKTLGQGFYLGAIFGSAIGAFFFFMGLLMLFSKEGESQVSGSAVIGTFFLLLILISAFFSAVGLLIGIVGGYIEEFSGKHREDKPAETIGDEEQPACQPGDGAV